MNKYVFPFHLGLDEAKKDFDFITQGNKDAPIVKPLLEAFNEFTGFLTRKDGDSLVMAIDGSVLLATVQTWVLRTPEFQIMARMDPDMFVAYTSKITTAIIGYTHDTREMSAEELDRELERMLKETEQRIKGEAGGSF